MLAREVMANAADRGWPPATRIGFRFLFCYVLLYLAPFPAGFVPGTGWIAAPYNRLWEVIVPWVGEHILRLPRPIRIVHTGSGDTMFDYVLALCFAVLAAAATAAWCALAWQARRQPRLAAALRVYVRYFLARTLILYGLVKVLKSQFGFPGPELLWPAFGETSPQGLLWKFMGYSTPYCIFTGVVEVVAGALLLFRRTTPAGALLSVAALAQVVMLNLCYDVPVKLFSLHLLAMAGFLAASDLRRLAALLFARVAPHRLPALRAAKLALVAGLIYPVLALSVDAWRRWGDGAPRPALYGLYEVESFAVAGVERAPLLTDPTRWRSIAVARYGALQLRFMDDAQDWFRIDDDPEHHTIVLTRFLEAYVLAYERPDADHLVLDGGFRGARIHVQLRKVDEREFLLVRQGFRWINEDSPNR